MKSLAERLLHEPSDEGLELAQNLRMKRDLLAAGNPEHATIKTCLIIGGGAMRGVYGGGVVSALEELGMTDTFDTVIGISAGAATAAYFLAGQARIGTTIYYEDLTKPEFINPLRFRNILNIGYLQHVFTEVKPLNQTAIANGRSNFYIGVTNREKIRSEYVAATEGRDIIQLIQASSAAPGVSRPVIIDGVEYSDGITTCKNPIDFALQTAAPTDILYVCNQPLRLKSGISGTEKLISRLAMHNESAEFRMTYFERHTDSDEVLGTEYPQEVRIGVLCPETMRLRRMSKNKGLLKQIATEATQQTLELLR